MTGRRQQRVCRIRKKRLPWKYKNCPPGRMQEVLQPRRLAGPANACKQRRAVDDLPGNTETNSSLSRRGSDVPMLAIANGTTAHA